MNDGESDVSLTLEVADGTLLPLGTFVTTLRRWHALLKAISDEVAPGQVEWLLQSLAMSDTDITITAHAGTRIRRQKAARKGGTP